ncbi:MAG: hypothetical protein LBH48_02270, partial [Bifidobacteriaceae bacterium]|nr:hypothetical protein [Bifidobacteriaceae bacterium]
MSRPFTTRRLIRTMPALAIALALTVPAALAPAQAAPQAIQDAVYEPSADSPDGYNPVNAWSVNVEMSGGQMRWQSGCLPYGTATYEAKDDGTWRFSRGDLSTKGCPGDMAQAANELIKLMEGANRWRREDFGKIGLVGGPTALHLSPYDSPPQVPVP